MGSKKVTKGWFSERRCSSWETKLINPRRQDETFGLKKKLGGGSGREALSCAGRVSVSEFWAGFYSCFILVQRLPTPAEAAAPGCASSLQIPGRDHRPCRAGRVQLVNRNLSTRGNEKPESFQIPQVDMTSCLLGDGTRLLKDQVLTC